MATSYNPDKVPPPLSDSSSYQDWRKIVDLWGKFTTCAPNKQGMAVIFSLKSSDQQKVLSIPTEQICAEDGLETVLKRLDELYLEDETLEMYSALEDFESYKRPSSLLINDFLIEFELKYDKIKNHGITYPEELLGFRLLKAANLSSADEKLAKATSHLKYPTMKLQLKKLFSEKKGLQQFDDTFFTKSCPPYRGIYRGKMQSKRTPSNWRYPNASSGSTNWRSPSYVPPSYTPSFKPPNLMPPPQAKPDSKKPQMNPLNPMGRVSTCGVCKSVMHWAAQCPHNAANTYISDVQAQEQMPLYPFDPYAATGNNFDTAEALELECEVILYQSDYDSPSQIPSLLSESFNHAVIDCGASKTVTGKSWWNVLYETLPSNLAQLVKYKPSKRVFRFGDGKRFVSESVISFPAYIGNFCKL